MSVRGLGDGLPVALVSQGAHGLPMAMPVRLGEGFGVSGGSEYHDALRSGPLRSIGWGAAATTLNG